MFGVRSNVRLGLCTRTTLTDELCVHWRNPATVSRNCRQHNPPIHAARAVLGWRLTNLNDDPALRSNASEQTSWQPQRLRQRTWQLGRPRQETRLAWSKPCDRHNQSRAQARPESGEQHSKSPLTVHSTLHSLNRRSKTTGARPSAEETRLNGAEFPAHSLPNN